MHRWLIGLALTGIGCAAKENLTEGLESAADQVGAAIAESEVLARGLVRAEPVPPLRGGYDDPPDQWDEARIYLDDKPAEGAVACLRDPSTILAQFSHGEAETIYTVSLRHPPMMTASSEGYSDDADWVRTETREGAASYEARFGKDRNDFGSKRVIIEAPADLRPCRR